MDYEFCSYPVIPFSRQLSASPASQAPCAYQVLENYSWAGALAPECRVSVLSPIKGEIHQNRPGQGKFGICSFKGIYIHIKMQFSSEI